MKPARDYPRGLSEDEQAAWSKLAATVEPMVGKAAPNAPVATTKSKSASLTASPAAAMLPRKQPLVPSREKAPPPASSKPAGNLDGHWDKRLKKGDVAPDFTLDLHGHSLGAAYQRLMRGMTQAKAMRARLVLVVTGKPRPVDAADRGTKRGAIRAKILDWLAASEHGLDIAAIRTAHRKHGGNGALYIVLKRGR